METELDILKKEFGYDSMVEEEFLKLLTEYFTEIGGDPKKINEAINPTNATSPAHAPATA